MINWGKLTFLGELMLIPILMYKTKQKKVFVKFDLSLRLLKNIWMHLFTKCISIKIEKECCKIIIFV